MTRCHAAAAEEEEDDNELCSAQKGGVGEISNVTRETEEKSTNAPITTAFASVNRTA